MTGSRSRRLRAGYAALNGVYWMLCCIIYSFSSNFLLGRGYTNSQLGLIIASGYILGLVLQSPAASAADRTARAPVAVLMVSAAAVGLTAAGLLFLPGRSLAVTAVYVLFLALVIMLQPMVNAFAYYIERFGIVIPFGMCRAMGSLAYGLLAAVLGWMILRTGTSAVPACALLTAAAMLVLMAWFSRQGTPSWEPQKIKEGKSSHSILRIRSFQALLAGCVMLFFSHSFLTGYMLQIVQGAGGNNRDMGMLTGYVAVLELPTMFLFDRFLKRFSCGGMLRFSAVFFAVQNLLVLLSGSMAGLYGGFFFQLIAYALFIPSSVRFTGDLSGPQDANRAQAYVTTMSTLGSVCASGLGGLLIDRLGLKAALGVTTASACLGAVTMVLGIRKE